MTTVALVGSRGLAPALCHLLGNNEHQIALWQPEQLGPSTLAEQHDHVENVELSALSDLPVIISCVPLTALREVGQQLGSVVSGRHIIVHCARAIEPGTYSTASTILKEVTPTHRFGFLTGPIHESDLIAGLLGAGIVASPFPEIHDIFEQLIVAPTFRLYRNHDILGAEYAASYARVMAYVLGVARGMRQGPSIQSTIFARGLAEMSKFVKAQGGKAQTVFGMSGTGTLYAELQGEGSLEHQLGQQTSEQGAFNLESLLAEHGLPAREFHDLVENLFLSLGGRGGAGHILTAAHAMVVQSIPALDVAKMLMALPVLED